MRPPRTSRKHRRCIALSHLCVDPGLWGGLLLVVPEGGDHNVQRPAYHVPHPQVRQGQADKAAVQGQDGLAVGGARRLHGCGASALSQQRLGAERGQLELAWRGPCVNSSRGSREILRRRSTTGTTTETYAVLTSGTGQSEALPPTRP